jgi:ABC-type sugar transport system ATPase subunit
MASVTLSDVSKIYPGNVKAVDGVNLEIHDKEFLVLVGPSGCAWSPAWRRFPRERSRLAIVS